MTDYLPDEILETSSVVANCTMNRERELAGSNGYDFEIGFRPLDLLRNVADSDRSVTWLDMCCGSGKALIQAADEAEQERLEVRITGVDLVGMFASPEERTSLKLVRSSLTNWNPEQTYDLITCIHGLHYIGDKLALIERATSWLTDSGQFVASLDLNNIVVSGFSTRVVSNAFRDAGFEFDTRKKLLKTVGTKDVRFPFQYIGADDNAGPNYTGQPVVNSHYQRAS